jgi:hypothetical protein
MLGQFLLVTQSSLFLFLHLLEVLSSFSYRGCELSYDLLVLDVTVKLSREIVDFPV